MQWSKHCYVILYRQRYIAQLDVPSQAAQIAQLKNSTIGKTLNTAAMFLGGASTTYWYVVARLNKPGADITEEVQIMIG